MLAIGGGGRDTLDGDGDDDFDEDDSDDLDEDDGLTQVRAGRQLHWRNRYIGNYETHSASATQGTTVHDGTAAFSGTCTGHG